LRVGVRVSLYDEVSEQFFGRTWCSELHDVPNAGRASTVDVSLGESAFYHTRVVDDTCYAIVEVVAEVSVPGDPAPSRTCALGWTTVPAFPPPANIPIDLGSCPGNNILLYGGSPRILLTLNKPIREVPFDRYALPGCLLEYRLHQHDPLADAQHLIRELVCPVPTWL